MKKYKGLESEVAEIKRIRKNLIRRLANIKKVDKANKTVSPMRQQLKKMGGLSKLNYVGKGTKGIKNTLEKLKRLNEYKTGYVRSYKHYNEVKRYSIERNKAIRQLYKGDRKQANDLIHNIEDVYARVVEEHRDLVDTKRLSQQLQDMIMEGLYNGYDKDTIYKNVDEWLRRLAEGDEDIESIDWRFVDYL